MSRYGSQFGVRFPEGVKVCLTSVSQPSSNPVGTVISTHGGEAAGAWGWPFTTI
jgi:hypothetical protein